MMKIVALLLVVQTSALRLKTSALRQEPEWGHQTQEEMEALWKWARKEITAGFPHQRPASPSLNFASEPCDAEVVVGFNVRHLNSGWGAHVNAFFDTLGMAAYGNKTVAMASAGTAFEGLWEKYFDTGLPVCAAKMTEKQKDAMESIEGMGKKFWIKMFTQEGGREHVAHWKRQLYQTYYKYTKETEDIIENTLKKFNLDGKKYYGVHIRGGDKAREADLVPPEEFGEEIVSNAGGKFSDYENLKPPTFGFEKTNSSVSMSVQNALQAADIILAKQDSGIRTVYLSTIEKEAADAFRKKLGESYDIKVLSDHDEQWHGDPTGHDIAGENLYHILADIEALRRATNYVGAGSSNFGRLIFFLRPEGSKSTSLDQDFLRGNRARG